MPVRVKLKAHKGQFFSQEWKRPLTVEHHQWMVLASIDDGNTWRHVGYIGKHKDAPFNGTRMAATLPANLQLEVKEALAIRLGHEPAMHIPSEPNPALLTGQEVETPDEP